MTGGGVELQKGSQVGVDTWAGRMVACGPGWVRACPRANRRANRADRRTDGQTVGRRMCQRWASERRAERRTGERNLKGGRKLAGGFSHGWPRERRGCS